MSTSQASEGWNTWLRERRTQRVACAFVTDVDGASTETADHGAGSLLVVRLEWENLPRLEDELGSVAAALGRAVQQLWPNLYGTSLSEGAAVPVEAHASGDDLLARARSVNGVQIHAARRIVEACGRGEIPRLDKYPLADRIRQLALALAPRRLLVVLTVRSSEASRDRVVAFVRGAEWIAASAPAPVVALLPRDFGARTEFDPISYDAFLEEEAPHAEARGNVGKQRSSETPGSFETGSRKPSVDAPKAPTTTSARPSASNGASARPATSSRASNGAALPGVAPQVSLGRVLGRPHPGSDAEKELHARLVADAELETCFGFNLPITTNSGQQYCVDLLAPHLRLIVEVDGDDHRRMGKFIADRKRDFELGVDGFLVVRLTDYEVLSDVELAVEKLRRAVRGRKVSVNP